MTVEEVSLEHEFHFRVGMAINLLDDEDFEHHNGVVGFTANLGGMQRTKDLLEGFPIDEFIDAREDIFWKILLLYKMFTIVNWLTTCILTISLVFRAILARDKAICWKIL